MGQANIPAAPWAAFSKLTGRDGMIPCLELLKTLLGGFGTTFPSIFADGNTQEAFPSFILSFLSPHSHNSANFLLNSMIPEPGKHQFIPTQILQILFHFQGLQVKKSWSNRGWGKTLC